jgi:putative transposase
MDKLSYRRHRFPSIIIQQAVWLYFRFALSYRDVEDMLAERGIDVSYETVRRWALKFGTIIARKLRRGRPRPDGRWHLDEVFVSINGRQLYVWRAGQRRRGPGHSRSTTARSQGGADSTCRRSRRRAA